MSRDKSYCFAYFFLVCCIEMEGCTLYSLCISYFVFYCIVVFCFVIELHDVRKGKGENPCSMLNRSDLIIRDKRVLTIHQAFWNTHCTRKIDGVTKR